MYDDTARQSPSYSLMSLKILVLEPYYGGSHKSFLSGLARLPFEFEYMTMPARKWKWRMRLSAPLFARKLSESGRRYDRILCSSYVDVAAFRGLAPSWVNDVPLLTYFHENQFAYPVRVRDERDFHFALTNMTTALASDRIAFNSHYNLNSFLEGMKKTLRLSHDLRLDDAADMIRSKSGILPPGIDFSYIDAMKIRKRADCPVILWNHRWEHDKGPELFFESLFRIDRAGINFRLVVLGESFENSPPIFHEAGKRLSDRLLHFGYVASRRDYARWLNHCSLAISTARHEFFGISVFEAIRAGCLPLLPNRLSYPELFSQKYLYDDRNFVARLKEEILKNRRLSPVRIRKLTERFSWGALAPLYTSWISGEKQADR
jgi:glycosyltransferase involved in cell wall biosynthesis